MSNNIVEIRNPVINYAISRIIPLKNIEDYDIVIAGGFPLAIFRAYYLYKDVEFISVLESHLSNKDGLKYGDIDIWRLKSDNGINASLDALFNHSDLQKNNNPINYLDSINPFVDGANLRFKYVFGKNSKWANSFVLFHNQTSRSLQFIKKEQDSVQSLINTFDLTLSMVAWSKGVLYVDQRCIDAISSRELTISKDYKFGKESIQLKVYRAKRFIKYLERYNISASKDICDYFLNTLLEICKDENWEKYNDKTLKSLVNKNKNNPNNPSTLGNMTAKVEIDDYLEELLNRIHFVRSILTKKNIEIIACQKNLDKGRLLFLMNNKVIFPIIKSLVEANFTIPSNFNFPKDILSNSN